MKDFRASRLVLLLAACGVLSGCLATSTQVKVAENDETALAASPDHIGSLTDVIQRNPNDAQPYNVRGAVLGRAGRNEEALADFDKALAIDPNFAQAYANRGLIHRQLKRYDRALADYNKAIEIDPNYAAAYVGRGMVKRAKGDALAALEDFNKAIEIKPDDSQAYYNRGLLYQAQRQHEYAIGDFTTAFALTRQQQAEPLIARALSHLANKDLKSAAADLDDAVKLEPQNFQAWASRGLAYERLGDKEKAAGSYARSMNINGEYMPAKQGFARVGGVFGRTYETF
jgi:tetratricopeptide (TPR) repeat protein